jgi:hypothetical protein
MSTTRRRKTRLTGSNRGALVVLAIVIGGALAISWWVIARQRPDEGPAGARTGSGAGGGAAGGDSGRVAPGPSPPKAGPPGDEPNGERLLAQGPGRVAGAKGTTGGGNGDRQGGNGRSSSADGGKSGGGEPPGLEPSLQPAPDINKMCNAADESEPAGASSTGGEAEGSRFAYANMPVITRADDLIDHLPSEPPSLPSQVKLVMVEAGQKLRQKGLQIRLFRLPREPQTRVPPAWRYFDPCCVYMSSVIKVSSEGGTEINLGTLDDRWLEPRGDGHIDGARWLLVFEQSTDKNQVFRIRRANMHDYFASGLVLEMTATEQDPESARAALKSINRSQADASMDLDSVGPRAPCYRYQRVEVRGDRGGPSSVLGVLVRCVGGEDQTTSVQGAALGGAPVVEKTTVATTGIGAMSDKGSLAGMTSTAAGALQ